MQTRPVGKLLRRVRSGSRKSLLQIPTKARDFPGNRPRIKDLKVGHALGRPDGLSVEPAPRLLERLDEFGVEPAPCLRTVAGDQLALDRLQDQPVRVTASQVHPLDPG